MHQPKVIAEIGINHNGKLNEALSLIESSFLSGCYGIKFQYRNLKRTYNNKNSKEIGDALLKTEINRCYLSPDEITYLSKVCHDRYNLKVGISFFTKEDIFDFKNIRNNFDFFKIPSVEFTNDLLIRELASYGKLLMLSLGCQEEKTIRNKIEYLNPEKTILMHCVSNYPLEIYNAKLGYINHLKQIWSGRIGYSSHDKDWRVCISAITLGIDFIERHITHDKMGLGLDHSTSSTPDEFKDLCYFSKELPLAMTGGNKRSLNAGELINKQNLGRSPYANQKIKKGDFITNEKIVWRSPQVGLTYEEFNDYFKKPITRSIEKDEPICTSHFTKIDDLCTLKRNWIKDNKISLPVRLHDSQIIKKSFHETFQELHLSFNETLSENLYDRENFSSDITYSIHLPDYIDSNSIIDPFSTDKYIKEKSMKIIGKCIQLSKNLHQITQKEIPLVGSFSTIYKNKEFSINQINNFCKENSLPGKFLLMPQLLPPIAWYFGGSVKLNLFNTINDLTIMQDIQCEYCLDISHAFMCNFLEDKFLEKILNSLELVKHIHIAGASGIDGEGEPISSMTENQLTFLKEIMKLPHIKVIEVWQGHLNNFSGFKKALNDLEKIFQENE